MGVELLGESQPWLKMLVHGMTGVGKTRLVVSALDVPEMQPVLYLDADRGTLSVRDRRNMLCWKLNFYPELNDVMNGPILDFEKYKEDHPEEPLPPVPFKTLIIDDLAEIWRLCMEYEMAQLIKSKPERDPHVPDRREYGRVRSRILKLMRLCRNLEMHVLIACQSQYERDVEEGILIYEPQLAGKLSAEISGYVDIQGYLTVTETKEEKGGRVRKLVVQPTRRIRAKDRAELGDAILENPTMTTIFQRCTHLT